MNTLISLHMSSFHLHGQSGPWLVCYVWINGITTTALIGGRQGIFQTRLLLWGTFSSFFIINAFIQLFNTAQNSISPHVFQPAFSVVLNPSFLNTHASWEGPVTSWTLLLLLSTSEGHHKCKFLNDHPYGGASYSMLSNKCSTVFPEKMVKNWTNIKVLVIFSITIGSMHLFDISKWL